MAFFGLTTQDRPNIFSQIHEIVFHGKGGYDWETVYNDLRPLITDDDFDEYNQSKIKAKYFGIDHLEYLHEPKMLSFLKVY